MKKSKRIISIATAFFMMLTMFAVPVAPVHAADSTIIKWTEGVKGGAIYFDTATGTIVDCDKSVTEVVIPETIDDVTVKGISQSAFSCTDVETITLPESICDIDEYAFNNCIKLENIYSDGLMASEKNDVSYFVYDGMLYESRIIDDDASWLIDVAKDNGYERASYLYISAFKLPMNDLRSEFVFPERKDLAQLKSETEKKTNCYYDYETVHNLYNGLAQPFYGCKNLNDITYVPNGSLIAHSGWTGDFGWHGIPNLENIYLTSNYNDFKSEDGVVYRKTAHPYEDEYVYVWEIINYPHNSKRTMYAVENDTKVIRSYAFYENNNIERVILPEGVEVIQSQSFYDCDSLKEVIFSDNEMYIEHHAILRCDSLERVEIPNGIEKLTEEIISECHSLTNIVIPESVNELGDFYYSCEGLARIDVDQNNQTYMSEDGVVYNKKQTELIIYPEGKEDKAFTVPDGVAKIQGRAFRNCDNLQNITIPRSVTSIGDGFPSNITIYGYLGSYAETYAKNNNIPFIALNKDVTITEGITITENDLYGEYALHLYPEGVMDELYCNVKEDISEIIWGRSEKENYRAVLKDNTNWVENLYTIITGKWFKQDDIEESLALELINALSQDESVMTDVVSDVEKTFGITSDTYKFTSTTFKSLKEKQDVAELLDSGYLYTEESAMEFIKDMESEWEDIDKIFENAGRAISIGEIILNIAVSMEANHEMITVLKDHVSDNTSLYNGLDILEGRQKECLEDNVAKRFLEYGLFEELIPTVASGLLGNVVGIGNICYATIAKVFNYDQAGFDDVYKAMTSYLNMGNLYQAVIDNALNISDMHDGNYSYDTDEEKNEHKFLFEAYLQATDFAVEYALKIAKPEQKKKLERDYEAFKQCASYDSYIESCKQNAAASWEYNTATGTITKYTDSKKEDSRTSLSEMFVTEVYADSNEKIILNIPEEIDGCKITTIGEGAFENCTDLYAVYIPDSTEYIEKDAFKGCENLEIVFLGGKTKVLGESSFAGCSSLKTIELPYSLEEINDTAFADIEHLTVVSAENPIVQQYVSNNTNVTLEENDLDIVEIKVESLPDKLTFGMSEELETTGIKVTGVLEDGSIRDISEQVDCHFENKVLGKSKVIVYYGDINTSYDVEVVADECQYTIFYKDEFGNEIAEAYSGIAMAGEKIDLKVKNVAGYIPDDPAQTAVIGEVNEFVVSYTAEPDININDAVIDDIPKQTYTGTQIKPSLTIKYNGKVLTEGTDYYLDYGENVNVGEGLVVVIGTGDYTGIIEKAFAIEKASPSVDENVYRIAGKDRFVTSLQVANVLKEDMGVSKFDNIVIASGTGFADALPGSYLAAEKNAPILLIGASNYSTIKDYVNSNLKPGGTIYVLGGTGVIPDNWVSGMPNVQRLGGKDRHATNLLILDAAGVDAGSDILVCTGSEFADSLSASATGKPILLVGTSLNDAQKAYLNRLSDESYYMIGGTGAVSDAVMNEFKAFGTVDRVAGSNRYATSVEVAKKFFGTPSSAVLAYGLNFPDGLSAGPLAYNINAPLILTATDSEKQAAAYAKSKGIKYGYVIGGSSLISDKSVKTIFQMSSSAKIKIK